MDFVLELAKLIKQTPKHHLPMQDCENCPYNSFLYKSKNCYLCYSSSYLEECFYMDKAIKNKDCADCDYLSGSELCYECLDSNQCYNCNYCRDCRNCTDSDFCYECRGCQNCFGCIGLQKKEFHIFNKKYSKENYFAEIEKLRMLSPAEIYAQTEELRKTFAHPCAHNSGSENTVGDYMYNSKNCFMCFNGGKSKDCLYCYDEALSSKDCTDCSHVLQSELVYNSMSIDNSYNVNCSWWVVNSNNCEYGFCNNGCSNCFGCVNVMRREYNILNRPYSKDDYFKKVDEIKRDLSAKGLYGKFLIMDAVELAKNL